MGVLYILAILLLRVVQNYCSKRSSQLFPVTMAGQIKYMAFLFTGSFILGLAAVLLGNASLRCDGLTLGLAAAAGATMVIAQLCMLLAMQSGSMVIVTAFSTAGLIVPCITGMLFLGEKMSTWQWLGVALFILASYLLGRSARLQNGRFGMKTVMLLLGALLGNGATMLCQKLLTYLRPDSSISAYSFYCFAIPALFFSLMILPAGSKRNAERINRKLYLLITLLAAALFAMNLLVTKATLYVPSAVLFTVPNAGNNVIAAVIAAVWIKEKITGYSLAGLILSILSLVLVLGLAG